MANSLLTPTVIAKELLMQFKNGMGFSRVADTSYSKDFGKKGAKIGTSEKIRKPNRFTTTTGASYSAQDVTEDSVTLTINTQRHVDFEFISSDLTMSVDDFANRYLKPAALALSNGVDIDGTTLAAKQVYNAVGTAATTPSALITYLNAMQKAQESAAPMDENFSYIINPAASAKIVDSLKGLFQSGDQISKQYMRGLMGQAAGGEWSLSQNLYSYTSGQQGGTPLVNGTQTEAASTLVTKGWTAAAANRLKAGDVFSIAGINKVNPITKQDSGQLQQFVVTADFASDASGNGSVSISPPLYSATSGSLQNITALPVDGNAISLVLGGASIGASAVTVNNLLVHKEAFGLAFVPLERPQGVDFSAVETDPETGISIRIARQWDIATDKFKTRCDVMYGWAALRPEWACKILG